MFILKYIEKFRWQLFGIPVSKFPTFLPAQSGKAYSQFPIFLWDRRGKASLIVNGGHLDFRMYWGGGRRGEVGGEKQREVAITSLQLAFTERVVPATQAFNNIGH